MTENITTSKSWEPVMIFVIYSVTYLSSNISESGRLFHLNDVDSHIFITKSLEPVIHFVGKPVTSDFPIFAKSGLRFQHNYVHERWM